MNLTMIIAALDKDASLDQDLMARMRILEGALDRPKGEFTRNRQAIGAALKELPLQYPDIDTDWFAIKDFDLYGALVQGARKVLPHESGIMTAEEVAQELAGGLGGGGAERTDTFRAAGKNLKDKILRGTADPAGVRRSLYTWAMKRAINVWDKMRRRQKHRQEEGGDALVREEGQMGVAEAMKDSPLQLLMTMLDSRYGHRIRNILFKTIDQKGTPAQKVVFETMIDHPEYGSQEIADDPKVIDALGVTDRRNIDGHRRRLRNLLLKEMETNSQVRDTIEDAVEMGLDLQDLMRGHHVRMANQDPVSRFWMKIRLAAQAISVARRYLHS